MSTETDNHSSQLASGDRPASLSALPGPRMPGKTMPFLPNRWSYPGIGATFRALLAAAIAAVLVSSCCISPSPTGALVLDESPAEPWPQALLPYRDERSSILGVWRRKSTIFDLHPAILLVEETIDCGQDGPLHVVVEVLDWLEHAAPGRPARNTHVAHGSYANGILRLDSKYPGAQFQSLFSVRVHGCHMLIIDSEVERLTKGVTDPADIQWREDLYIDEVFIATDYPACGAYLRWKDYVQMSRLHQLSIANGPYVVGSDQPCPASRRQDYVEMSRLRQLSCPPSPRTEQPASSE